ncbi:MAG: acyl CoA:acetate/3-ketoacid CoA transferase, alpha subunit, partial [uncultured bacterium]
GMSARFKAGAMGVPFLPTRDHGGSALELANRGRMTRCPFSGENIYLVPACHPDLGIVHVQAADMYGNSRIFGPLCTCPEIARASVNTIITAEQIIPNAAIRNRPNLTEIPYPVVDAVIHQPFGATPGTCYGNYWFDMAYIENFGEICEDFCKTGNKEKLRAFYNKHIFDVDDFDEFLEQKPYPVLKELCHLDGDRSVILD